MKSNAMSLLDWLRKGSQDSYEPVPPPAPLSPGAPKGVPVSALPEDRRAMQSHRLPWTPPAPAAPPVPPAATIPLGEMYRKQPTQALSAEPAVPFAPPPPPKPVPPPMPPGVLPLEKGKEAEQIAAHIEQEIQRRFQEGVVVIAHEILADGLDNESIEVRIAPGAYDVLTKSVKRQHVLHAYLTKRLVQARQDCYLKYGLPHAAADLFQRYRIINAKTDAFTEPLGLLLVEKYDLDSTEQAPIPERFFYPVISECTFLGRNESEALRSGQLSPEKDYIELGEFEGLSVFHLKVRANEEGSAFWVTYTGNENNRRAMFYRNKTMNGQAAFVAPVVFGPASDAPYMQVQLIPNIISDTPPALPDDEVDVSVPMEDDVALGAEAAPSVHRLDIPPGALADQAARAGFRSLQMQAAARDQGRVGQTIRLTLPPQAPVEVEEPAPEPHSELHVAVFTKRADDATYTSKLEKTYLLHADHVLIGRQPESDREEVECIAVDFGEALLVENLVISRAHVMLHFADGTVAARQLNTTNQAVELQEDERMPLSNTTPEVLAGCSFYIEGRVKSRDIKIVFTLHDTSAAEEAA